jgi:DNA topoisomerase-1
MPKKKTAILDLPSQVPPVESAQQAHLRYVNDNDPGIQRKRAGKGFSYLGADGKRLTDPETLDRIKHLSIPPAWTHVWICPIPNGHIQVTGRDARGRKQYRYHARWREVRDETKFSRMLAFGQALPQIRKRLEKDLARSGLPKEKILATVIQLMETTLIRVGNPEYARNNHSFGLTTLRDQHANINGSKIHFKFRGKSGKIHEIDVKDRQLAKVVKRCQDLPGHELFQYVDDAEQTHTITSHDVNSYLKEITGQDFTAKDFRTWYGTVLGIETLREVGESDTQAEAKKNIVQTIKLVAERLGNTTAVCKKYYIHPAVLNSYLEGTLIDTLKEDAAHLPSDLPDGLDQGEIAVMCFLRHLMQVA